MFRTLAVAAGLATTIVGLAAPAMADAYCGPGFYYRYGECRPYAYAPPPPGVVGAAAGTAGAAVGGAGYVAGSAVNAAGNVAGAAVGTAGNIVGCVLGCR